MTVAWCDGCRRVAAQVNAVIADADGRRRWLCPYCEQQFRVTPPPTPDPTPGVRDEVAWLALSATEQGLILHHALIHAGLKRQPQVQPRPER